MKVSHSRVPHLNAEWEFSVIGLLYRRLFAFRVVLTRFAVSFFYLFVVVV